ncbi:MAG: UDP-N-acetylmuramoyl-tripeptide--D-alanyl-D-alanine ligase [Bacilli bacterium]|nr:UDP-N-acetylmuramoyl-tripeptide--D-alanyl-D-alanine ligase [Bacilli bacterium]
MTIKELIKLIDGKALNLPKNIKKEIKSFRLNSKEVEKDDVFICINNGYLYIDDAINNGAVCIISDRDIHIKSEVCILKVTDIKDTLLKITGYIRDKYKYIPLIAITGSVGKTTTKELLDHILSSKYKVLKNDGNKNNYIGISETMFKLNNDYDVVILEVGMNHFGEIDEISKAIKPEIATITNIGTSHIGYLGSVKNILKAKMEIVNGMHNGDLVVPYLDKLLKHIKYDNINKCRDVKISNIKVTDKLNFDLKYQEDKYNISFNIPNKSYISNILVAFELSTYFVIHPKDVVERINSYEAVASRMNIIDMVDYKIIDDTYNSSYESLKGVLDYVKKIKGNKLVILGDIKELGEYSPRIHKKINKLLKNVDKDDILLVGEDTKYIDGIHFIDNDDIINYLNKINLKDYTILVKGSRLMHMEDIVNSLIK